MGKMAELSEVNTYEEFLDRSAGLCHSACDEATLLPCQVPRLSWPFVIGIEIVGPMRDVFVCDTESLDAQSV